MRIAGRGFSEWLRTSGETMRTAAVPEFGPALGGVGGYEPKIAFVRWLAEHPGKTPSNFQPLIKEAGFAYRCRAPSVPACDDLGGTRIMERQLRNLELGLCSGWCALTRSEACSLAKWLNAVLPHHPWCAALRWRESDAHVALQEYCRGEGIQSVSRELRQSIASAGLSAVFDQACSFMTWRDVQALVLGAWLGGELLVDEYGCLITDWRDRFARVLAATAASPN